MATMRPLLRRVELRWIGFLLVGALCGALVMFGVDTLRQTNSDVAAPQIAAPQVVAPQVAAPVQAVTTSVVVAPAAAPSAAGPLGEGLMGSRDSTPAPASTQRIVGPGEGVNAVAP